MLNVILDVRECDGHVIVALRGDLDLADAADVAAALIAAAVGRRCTIVDLAGLAFIDCSGTAALARAQRSVRRDGGSLLLAAPRPRVLRVFQLSRLIDAASVYPSLALAASVREVSGDWLLH
jgi:anti-sigma B factor antagonist